MPSYFIGLKIIYGLKIVYMFGYMPATLALPLTQTRGEGWLRNM